MSRRAATTRLGGAAIAVAALLVVFAGPALVPSAAAASTVSFTCLTQSAALALITANPPGSMGPDTSTCPGFYDGYYTPSASTSTTTSVSTSASNVVTGSGTQSGSSTVSYSGIVAPGSTSAAPLYIACTTTGTGTAAGAPPVTTSLPTTYPSTATRTGSAATLTGTITTDSPGTSVANSVYASPCPPSSTLSTTTNGTVELGGIINLVYTYPSVTIQLPSGDTVSGGLVITLQGTFDLSVTVASGAVSGTTSITYGLGTITGTGGLAGANGTYNQITNAVTANGSTTTSATYWFSLSNIP